MSNYDVDQIYQDFWKEIICDKYGNIDVEQVKNELCDYYKMLQEVPKVYCEVTGGILSKPLYDAETVLSFLEIDMQIKLEMLIIYRMIGILSQQNVKPMQIIRKQFLII